ncbi:type VI secretion system-associated protein TagF, partial [Phreatobacter sp. AB_2022a]|uniref:type VI secretion system-associated protein TagF n=1 Tax=Phreatobacter sp. AB_2022a TaxID=3003134 RepID=UPI0022875313
MSHGLFGKLPAKRDFVAFDLPSAVLRPWETWLQGAMAASRHVLGADWTGIFLKAPIWRFWCGAGVLDQPLLGALMPSVDGVGRYFPLTVAAVAEEGTHFVPPATDSRSAYFAALEELMLSALDPALDVDAFRRSLKALDPPAAMAGAPARA